jgi:hypothetical protein
MAGENTTINNITGQAFGGLPNPDQCVDIDVPASTPLITRLGGGSAAKPLVVDQCVDIDLPASTPLDTRLGGGSSARPLVVDQPVTVSTPGVSTNNVAGGSFKPGGVAVNRQQDRIEDQTFSAGKGLPSNVFV